MKSHEMQDFFDFFNEAEITPEELLYEVEDALCKINPKSKLWHALLTFADFLERLVY